MQLIGLTILHVHIQCKALIFIRIISMTQVYRMFRTSTVLVGLQANNSFVINTGVYVYIYIYIYSVKRGDESSFSVRKICKTHPKITGENYDQVKQRRIVV